MGCDLAHLAHLAIQNGPGPFKTSMKSMNSEDSEDAALTLHPMANHPGSNCSKVPWVKTAQVAQIEPLRLGVCPKRSSYAKSALPTRSASVMDAHGAGIPSSALFHVGKSGATKSRLILIRMVENFASPVALGPTEPRHLENTRERKKGLSHNSQQARWSDISWKHTNICVYTQVSQLCIDACINTNAFIH